MFSLLVEQMVHGSCEPGAVPVSEGTGLGLSFSTYIMGKLDDTCPELLSFGFVWGEHSWYLQLAHTGDGCRSKAQ